VEELGVTLVALEPVDRVDVTTLVDNTADMLLPDVGPVRRWGLSGTSGSLPVAPSGAAVGGSTFDFLRAEHGYSALVDVYRGGRMHRVLYDTGVSPFGLVENLDRLGISPDTFQAIVLSHGHFDHVAGMHGLIKRLAARNLPVLLHPDFWTRRRIASPDRFVDLPTPSRAAIEDAGFALIEDRQPSFLLGGMLLVTGEVPRRTAFETGLPPGHQAWVDGQWRHDPLVHEDQALVAHVRGRGLVIVTGCGHAGIVNIVRQAKRLTGVDQILLVTGGLHLRDDPALAATVTALTEERPQLIVPAHCTSWLAHHALYDAMPQAYRPNSVGSRFELKAAPETNPGAAVAGPMGRAEVTT
jgi:7,8-dihydropterin-6-yl-methyl-4-(beta-D-ribofuranosyl)aminobenzene 5'-phosphate synthase